MFSQVPWDHNNNVIAKFYCTYRNHVAIPKRNKNKTKQNKKNTKNNNKTQKQQQHMIAPVYITGGDAIRHLL